MVSTYQGNMFFFFLFNFFSFNLSHAMLMILNRVVEN